MFLHNVNFSLDFAKNRGHTISCVLDDRKTEDKNVRNTPKMEEEKSEKPTPKNHACRPAAQQAYISTSCGRVYLCAKPCHPPHVMVANPPS